MSPGENYFQGQPKKRQSSSNNSFFVPAHSNITN